MTTSLSPYHLGHDSGVGVLDKASLLLSVLETGPASLRRIVATTGLTRPTAHRLALALEHLRLLTRDTRGRFVLGPRLGEMAVEAHGDWMLASAAVILPELRDRVGADVRLFRRHGDRQVCVAGAEASTVLSQRVATGAAFPLTAGSVAQVLLAWEEPVQLYEALRTARFSAATLAGVRRRGWAQSVGEWGAGSATVTAPVRGPSGQVVAALSLSGPVGWLSRDPGREYGTVVLDAAIQLSAGPHA